MASFEKSFNKVLAAEGRYSANPNDSGNYLPNTGDFKARRNIIGSKYGITPGTYKDAFGRNPTAAAMQALTIDQARAAYKKLFWDQVKGDQIADQQIADIVFDHAVNTNPKKAVRLLAATLTLLGTPATGNNMDTAKVVALNNIAPELFFKYFKQARLAYYRANSKPFLTGLTKRVNQFNYTT